MTHSDEVYEAIALNIIKSTKESHNPIEMISAIIGLSNKQIAQAISNRDETIGERTIRFWRTGERPVPEKWHIAIANLHCYALACANVLVEIWHKNGCSDFDQKTTSLCEAIALTFIQDGVTDWQEEASRELGKIMDAFKRLANRSIN